MPSELTPSNIELSSEEVFAYLDKDATQEKINRLLRKVMKHVGVTDVEGETYHADQKQVTDALKLLAVTCILEEHQKDRYRMALDYERILFDQFADQCTCGAADVCKGLPSMNIPPMSIEEALASSGSSN